MTATEQARTDQPLRDSKVRDRALVLLLVGSLLLISPLAGVFQVDIKLAGVPFTLVYLFVVWGILIAGALALSHRLRDVGAVASDFESSAAAERWPAASAFVDDGRSGS